MYLLRKGFSTLSVALAGTLLIAAMAAASAQAQVSINPDNTPITGTATNLTLDYEGRVWQCDIGTVSGTTGLNSAVVDVAPTFAGNCNMAGLSGTITCDGTARLRALTADTNLGEIDRLNEGFVCELTVPGVCTVSFAAQELPIGGGVNSANLLNEGGDTVLNVIIDVAATRTGSAVCGPPSGVMRITAFYALSPDFSFDLDP